MTSTLVPSGCCVRLIDLPVSVGAMVAVDEDGFASIYLNSRLSHEKQRDALRHELRHIDHDDAYTTTDRKDAERRADGVIWRHTAVMRDRVTLKRLGILTDIKHDPLLDLPNYNY